MARQSIAECFWNKVDQSAGIDGCWIWTGAKGTGGYGSFNLRGAAMKSHRVAWQFAYGEIPKGSHHGTMCVLHRCDNPACVNPSHLFLGTHGDNMRDMVRKKRHAQPNQKGEANRNAKLTEEQIRSIRIDTRSQYQIARDYGIHQMTVSDILRRRIWKHVL